MREREEGEDRDELCRGGVDRVGSRIIVGGMGGMV